MNWYPQSGSGSLTQFPLRRSTKWRAIRNQLESGEQILLPDVTSGSIEWSLSYKELNDTEIQKLTDLHIASSGSYRSFGFVDPLANLMAWSEDLSRPDWQMGLITQAGALPDSERGQRAFALTNSNPGAQQVAQTVGIPGDYIACFSLWLRSDLPGVTALQRDGVQLVVNLSSGWKRHYLSGPGVSGAAESTFSIQLNAGQSLEVWGMQVEAQPYPSQYKSTTAPSGIYSETYFADDELTITSTAPGLSACSVKLLSRV